LTAELDFGLHNPNIEMPDGHLMLDDVAGEPYTPPSVQSLVILNNISTLELDVGFHPSGPAAESSLDVESEDAGDGQGELLLLSVILSF
jgi:hypothetical protein